MKRTAALFFVFGAAFLLSGCGLKPTSQNGNTQTQTSAQNQPGSGGVINSIRDAIGLGQKMECTYTYKNGDQTLTSTALVQGEKFRAEEVIEGKKQTIVFDGNTTYTWSDEDKKGTKWENTCFDDVKNDPQESALAENQVPDAEEVFADTTDTKCTPVSSIDFSIPNDVTFEDQCALFKEQMKSLEDQKTQLPEGVSIPGNVPGSGSVDSNLSL